MPNYIYTLLKRVIESKNPNFTNDELNLLTMNFFTTGQLDQTQYDELNNLLNPTEEPTTV